jgi:hypothetical protein
MARTSPSFRRWGQLPQAPAAAADDRVADHGRALADGDVHSCAHEADTPRRVEADHTPRWTARRLHSSVTPRLPHLSPPPATCRLEALPTDWTPVRWGDLVRLHRFRLTPPGRRDGHRRRPRAAARYRSPSKSRGARTLRQHLRRQSSRLAHHRRQWCQRGRPDKDWARRSSPWRDGRADAGRDHDEGDVDVRSCCLVE